MNKIILIAKREIAERFQNRSFKWLMVIGPLAVLGMIYLFLSTTTSTNKEWKVLLMDQEEIFNAKLTANPPKNLNFDFINAFVDYEEFAHEERYQNYDLSVWINEKIVSNKKVIVSYRERPPESIQRQIIYLVERRMEEIMVDQFTDLSIEKFREIKQSLNFTFTDVYDPKNEKSTTESWVGFSFGALIILFVFMFGMTILRSVSREKSNRIVEVLLSSVNARQLLTGKVLGVGFSALVQFAVWTIIVGTGLYLFRQSLFPDMFSASLVADEVANADISYDLANQSPFVELIYSQIQYMNMLVFFSLFFIGGYIFYGSFFAMIGASMGSESDGQQFIIPLTLLLFISVLSGYYVVYYPSTTLSTWLGFIPFTSPMVMMVELSNGFQEGSVWKLILSISILFVSAFFMMIIAGRIYKNGILRFNHRLKLRMLIKWTKK
ncbi:ABC transporter permease [Brumimicrobium mesophilum]|uniref:ABC transporter permease n=1 Tax=Brumimicrobium mesophilum TaxID=392717 RepID=UPI000D140EEF|nr:ABC transporter permease [Brumimicrobium mesophilum]